MPRNNRGHRFTRWNNFIEHVTRQNLNVIAFRDAQKVKDACAKWEYYLKLQELSK